VKLADLKILVQEGEGTTLEFKENLPASLARDLVAMANTIGGRILLGVRDDGTVVGVKDSNSLRARIQDIARNCDPPVKVVVEPVGEVLVIHVRESDEKPVQCADGFFWRQGAATQKLSRDEIRDFFRSEGAIRFDLSPCPRFRYPQDFDHAKFNAWLKLSGITGKPRAEDVLVNIEAAERAGGKLLLRNAGVLFFAKNVRHFFNQAYITCLLAKGTDKVHILDRKDFDGGIVADIEDALRFVERNTRLAYRIERLQRENIPEYPMKALREAITNAVMHRDWFIEGANVFVEIYDDRIKVVSPGGLPKGMTLADLGTKSVRRNALIADLLHRIGFIEKAGTGVKRIRDEARDGGYPEPVWEANGFVTTIFRPSAEVRAMAETQAAVSPGPSRDQVGTKLALSWHQVQILRNCGEEQPLTALMEVAGRSDRTKFRNQVLRPLLDAGLIELTIPDKPRSSKQRYRLTAAGIAYLSGLEDKKPAKKGRGK
jgi:ATP-dependent DNA helicase RecG